MRTRRFAKSSYDRPFDHDGSSKTKMFGAEVTLLVTTGFSASELGPSLGLKCIYLQLPKELR